MAENVLEVCKVTPSHGSPIDISLPLTFFDLLSFKIPPPERLFFYEAPYPEKLFSRSVLPKLKHALSITLQHYLPLSGSLSWPFSSPCPIIHYTKGDGVLLTVTRSDSDFYHLSGNGIRECKLFRPFVARIVGSDSQVPTFALKVTIFANKGFCIGITVHHGVFDAKSLALFMKSWASIAKFGENKGLLPELTPVFDRKSIKKRYAKTEHSYIEFLKQNGFTQYSLGDIQESEPLPGRVRRTFELSSSDVRNLKELVRIGYQNSNKIPFMSTLAVAYAYVIICLVDLVKSSICVGFPVDLRGRVEPPLPANYFGNCVGPRTMEFDQEELLGKCGMTLIVNSISRIVNSVGDGIVDGVEQRLPQVFSGLADTNTESTINVFVGNSSGLGFQRMDFGWGKPRKVDITIVDKMSAVAFEEENGGTSVELSLNMPEMERFSHIFTQGLGNMIKHIGSSL